MLKLISGLQLDRKMSNVPLLNTEKKCRNFKLWKIMSKQLKSPEVIEAKVRIYFYTDINVDEFDC